MSDEQPPESWGLVVPFWIDTEGYTDRDRDMFVCGYEFCMVYEAARSGSGWKQCIHAENSSRIRMLLGRMKIPFTMVPHCETWTNLYIEPESKSTT